MIQHIASNGCMNIFGLANTFGGYSRKKGFEIDFNYFNKANLTYKIGKFTTDEIINSIKDAQEYKETIEKMYVLVIFLREIITQKIQSN